jgi:plastocyanin
MTRRQALWSGGGFLAALSFHGAARAGSMTKIVMKGNKDGSRVWFDPMGLHVKPGQIVQWTNLDAGNSHTATAYDQANFNRPRRIPNGATAWDSDYLLPGETYSVTLTLPGVYDYYCVPHEHAGMVGRIVVGNPPSGGWPAPQNTPAAESALPEAALSAFPSIEDIVRDGTVYYRI